MADRAFVKRDALSFGWSVVKTRPVWILIFLIQIAINAGGTALSRRLGGAESVALQAVLFVFSLFLSFNVFAAALKSCDGKDVSVRDLFIVQSRFVPFLLASILLTVVVAAASFVMILAMTALSSGAVAMGGRVVVVILLLAGFIAFTVMYLLFLVRFSFFPFFVLEAGAGAVSGFRESWRLTAGVTGRLLVFLLLVLLINLGGFVCFFVGLLLTAPVTFLATAHVYRQLAAQRAAALA